MENVIVISFGDIKNPLTIKKYPCKEIYKEIDGGGALVAVLGGRNPPLESVYLMTDFTSKHPQNLIVFGILEKDYEEAKKFLCKPFQELIQRTQNLVNIFENFKV